MSSFAILLYPLNPNRDAWLLKRCINQIPADISKVVETWVLKKRLISYSLLRDTRPRCAFVAECHILHVAD